MAIRGVGSRNRGHQNRVSSSRKKTTTVKQVKTKINHSAKTAAAKSSKLQRQQIHRLRRKQIRHQKRVRRQNPLLKIQRQIPEQGQAIREK